MQPSHKAQAGGPAHRHPATPSGLLFILSAPSGAGKSTLCSAIRRRFDDLAYSISYTTRSAREGEENGRDYHFITKTEFEDGISAGRWAEWARVHGHYYGTSAQWIENALARGRHILMDIDVQGMRQLIEHFPDAVTIFIMPPSMQILEHRLRQRRTDDEKSIGVRLKNAEQEIAQKDLYAHILVNDDLSRAIDELTDLIAAFRDRAAVDGQARQ